MLLVKKYWPLLFFVIIFLVYSYPYFFQGKIPFPSSYLANDITPWKNYLYGGTVKNGIPDVPGEIYPMRSLVIDFWKKGIIPLWNPYILSGTPFLANFQSAVFFPLNMLFFLLPKVEAWSWLVLLQPLLAGIFTYLLAKSLKLSRLSAMFSAVSFMFCGYLTVWGSYATMGYAILFLPLVLYLVEKYFADHKPYYLPLITFTLAVSFFAGHVQSWLYVFLAALTYVIARSVYAVNVATKQSLLKIILFILLSIPLVVIQLLPTIEFYNFSSRSLAQNNPSSVGIPLQYLITIISPDFYGNPVTRNDWFGSYAEWMGYAGLIALMLAIFILLCRRKEKLVYPYIVIGIVGLALSLKTPILQILTTLPIPILKNSNPSRAIVLFSFSISVLSGFGLEEIRRNFEKREKVLLISVIVAMSVLLLCWLSIFGGKYFLPADIVNNLRNISLRNLILPTLIISLVFAMTILATRKKIPVGFLVFGFVVLLLLEMLRFYQKWTPFDDKKLFYPKTIVAKFLETNQKESRIYGQFGQTAGYIDRLYSLEGYEPLNLTNYGDFIDSSDGIYTHQYRLQVKLESQQKYTKRVLDLLGVKYLIYDAKDLRSPFVYPIWKEDQNKYPKIFDDGKYVIFANSEALPRAALFYNFKVIVSPKQALETFFGSQFNFKDSVILDRDVKLSANLPSSGSAKIINYTPQKITIEANSSQEGLLFLSDSYYQGWKAYVNNNPSVIYLADSAFRAVKVPEGKSSVVFKYEPDSFKYGAMVSIGTLIILVILSLRGVLLSRTTKQSQLRKRLPRPASPDSQ